MVWGYCHSVKEQLPSYWRFRLPTPTPWYYRQIFHRHYFGRIIQQLHLWTGILRLKVPSEHRQQKVAKLQNTSNLEIWNRNFFYTKIYEETRAPRATCLGLLSRTVRTQKKSRSAMPTTMHRLSAESPLPQPQHQPKKSPPVSKKNSPTCFWSPRETKKEWLTEVSEIELRGHWIFKILWCRRWNWNWTMWLTDGIGSNNVQNIQKYPIMSAIAKKMLLPFPTSYLMECGFSTVVDILTERITQTSLWNSRTHYWQMLSSYVLDWSARDWTSLPIATRRFHEGLWFPSTSAPRPDQKLLEQYQNFTSNGANKEKFDAFLLVALTRSNAPLPLGMKMYLCQGEFCTRLRLTGGIVVKEEVTTPKCDH